MAERTCSKCDESKPFTDEFFPRRGDGLRGVCRKCRGGQSRASYEKNRDGILAYQAGYRAANKDKRRAWHLAYRAQPEVLEVGRLAARAYRATPEGRQKMAEANRRRDRVDVLISAHRTRARKAGVLSTLTAEQWRGVLEHFDHSCAYCGSAEKLTIDHVVTMSRGGHNAAHNVVPACLRCNDQKFNRDMLAWYSTRPFFDDLKLQKIVHHMR
ncbi:MAG: HNH endonuclease [Gemmatimonadaceae bacterium]